MMSQTSARRMSLFLGAFLVVNVSLSVAPQPAMAAELTPMGDPIFDAAIEYAWAVAVSPDGNDVYVTSDCRY